MPSIQDKNALAYDAKTNPQAAEVLADHYEETGSPELAKNWRTVASLQRKAKFKVGQLVYWKHDPMTRDAKPWQIVETFFQTRHNQPTYRIKSEDEYYTVLEESLRKLSAALKRRAYTSRRLY